MVRQTDMQTDNAIAVCPLLSYDSGTKIHKIHKLWFRTIEGRQVSITGHFVL